MDHKPKKKNTLNAIRLIQKDMGHSSLAVSLTYLRGLEVSDLEESDMPLL